MRLILAIWLSLACAPPAVAQTTKFYDKQGNYQGQLKPEGSRLVARDKNGNPQGYYERQGSQIIHRDTNGNRLGYEVPPKPCC